MVKKVTMGQVFSKYLGCLANFYSTNYSTLIILYHPALGKQRQMYQLDSVSPHPKKLKKKREMYYGWLKSAVLNDLGDKN